MKHAVMLLMLCIALCCSCSRESLGDKAKRATNKAGKIVGEGAGSFFAGVGEGVEKTVTSYDVRLSDELKDLGVSVTIAMRTEGNSSNNWQHALSFYVVNKAPVSGALRLRLFNEKDQEIGRAIAQVDFKADDARYVPFTIEKGIPLTLAKYVHLDLKEPNLEKE